MTTSTAVAVGDCHIEVPEGRIFCRTWSVVSGQSSAPIVLLHDSLGCVELWREFPARLAQATGRNVIAYDRLGFGKSDPRRMRPSLDFVAEETGSGFASVRSALGFGDFIAFGHSVGGGMAIHCAAAYPQACKALVTESAQVFAEDLTLASIRAAREQFGDPAQLQRLARYHGEKAAWVLDAWTENWLDPGFASWNLREALAQVRCPVLALHGEHDEYGTHAHPTRIGETVSGPARIEIIPGTAHVPHREREELVLALVAGFLGDDGRELQGSGPRPSC